MSTSILLELCKCLVIHPATCSGLSVTLTTSISMSLSVSLIFRMFFFTQPVERDEGYFSSWPLWHLARPGGFRSASRRLWLGFRAAQIKVDRLID